MPMGQTIPAYSRLLDKARNQRMAHVGLVFVHAGRAMVRGRMALDGLPDEAAQLAHADEVGPRDAKSYVWSEPVGQDLGGLAVIAVMAVMAVMADLGDIGDIGVVSVAARGATYALYRRRVDAHWPPRDTSLGAAKTPGVFGERAIECAPYSALRRRNAGMSYSSVGTSARSGSRDFCICCSC